MNTEPSTDYFDQIRALLASDMPDIDKLRQFFGDVTDQIVQYARHDIELCRAMQDDESLLKVQIKMSTIQHARQIFATGYKMITGQEAWHDARDG